MPFTFAHPAIVLPLVGRRRKILSATGLIIGSISPDFESFIRFAEHKIYSHNWPGIFWFDLPLSVLLAFVFHDIVRDPLIKNLPAFLSGRFRPFTGFNWNTFFHRHFVVVIVSVLLGISSHLLWDEFTKFNWVHPNGHNRDMVIWNVHFHIFLQQASSVIGLTVICWFILRLPVTASGNSTPVKGKIQYWTVVAITAILIVIAAFCLAAAPITPVAWLDMTISGMLLGLVVASVFRNADFL